MIWHSSIGSSAVLICQAAQSGLCYSAGSWNKKMHSFWKAFFRLFDVELLPTSQLLWVWERAAIRQQNVDDSSFTHVEKCDVRRMTARRIQQIVTISRQKNRFLLEIPDANLTALRNDATQFAVQALKIKQRDERNDRLMRILRVRLQKHSVLPAWTVWALAESACLSSGRWFAEWRLHSKWPNI